PRRMAAGEAARGRRLGRGRGGLLAGTSHRGEGEHALTDGMGAAGADGGGRSRQPRGGARRELPPVASPRGLEVGGTVVHRGRLSTGFLLAVPRIQRLFSGLGTGALSQSQAIQHAPACLGDVSRIAVVTGLQLEARLLTPRGRAAHGAFPYVYCTGGSRIRCAEKVDQAVARGALGLVSFGVVGALDPGLA